MTRLTSTGLPFLTPEDDESTELDWSGTTPVEQGAGGLDWSGTSSVTPDGGGLDWSGTSEVTQPRPSYGATPEDVLRMIQSDPEKARVIFESIKNKSEKSFSQKVNDNIGPIGRSMRAAGEESGRFVVNSMMRGLSYVPGLEGLSDHANHMNRLASIQAAYDDYLTETGLTADLLTPAGAKLMGGVTQAVSQAILTGGAGKLARLRSPRGFTAWFAGTMGAMDAERSLTVAEDAGLEGAVANGYAVGMGGLTASLTLLGGLAGEKLGSFTAEEIMSRGVGRALSKLATREGLKQELIGAILEGGEEEAIALTQSLYGAMFGMETFDAYKDNVGQAFVAGAATRGILGAGRRLQTKYLEVANRVPATVEGFIDAQEVAAGNKSADDSDIMAKSKSSSYYRAAFDEELKTSVSLREGFTKELQPLVKERRRLEKEFNELEGKAPPGVAARIIELSQKEADLVQQIKETRLPEKIVGLKDQESDLREKLRVKKVALRAAHAGKKGKPKLDAEAKKLSRDLKALVEEREELEAFADFPESEQMGAVLKKIADLSFKETNIRKRLTPEGAIPYRNNVARLDDEVRAQMLDADKVDITSARQADIDRDREFFGLNELPPQDQQSFLDLLQASRAEGIPERALGIAKEALEKKSAWDAKTTVGITDATRKVIQDLRENRKQIIGPPEHFDLDSALAKDSELLGKLSILTEANHRAGSEVGRALRSRQFDFADENDPAVSIMRARRSKGDILTREETDSILEASERVTKLKKELRDIDPDSPAHVEKRFEISKAEKVLKTAEIIPGRRTFLSAMDAGTLAWKGVLTTVDLSFAGVQAGVSLLGHPVLTLQSLSRSIPQGLTRERALRYEFGLFERPNADRYLKGDITILREDAPVDLIEDMAARSIKQKWGYLDFIKNFINVWPRFFRVMSNGLRADLYDALIATNGGRGAFTDSELQQIGRFVDVATGRGGRGYFDKYMPAATVAMFAPRFTLSQLEFATLAPIWKADPLARKIILQEYGRVLASWLTMYSLAAVANMFSNAADEGDVAEVDFDPVSSGFLKMKFGDVVVDPTFRYGRYMSALAQTASQVRKMFGPDDKPYVDFFKDFHTSDKKTDAGRGVMSLLRGKLNMAPGTFVDLVTTRNIKGERVTPSNLFFDRFTPISSQQLAESVDEWGIPKGTAIGAVQFFGFGVSRDYLAAKAREEARKKFFR